MTDMEKFVGKWEVTEIENMDEMLQALDMEPEKRAMYCNMRFTMEYTHNGTEWTNTVHMPGGHSHTFTFTLGQEYDSHTLDGRPIISLVKAEDGKFVEYHKDKADPTLDAQMVREVAEDMLIVRATVKGVTSLTRHKKV